MRVSSLAASAVSVALLTGAAPADALSLRRAVEPPPPAFAAGPPLGGPAHEKTFSDPFQLQTYCNAFLGRPPHGYYQACFIPILHEIVLPDARAWPSAAERQALRAHEWAHARGWRHERPVTASAY